MKFNTDLDIGTATIIPMTVQRMFCTACGAEANASCNCGQPYIPAKQRAAEAIAANPQKPDRAIASDIGVDHKTVGAARKESTGEHSPVEPRVGIDGKTRRMPVRKAKRTQRPDEVEADEADEGDSDEVCWRRGLLY